MKKRGQINLPAGAAAALLVLFMALFILIYFILLPADERNILLELNESEDDVDDNLNIEGEVLLSKSPGQVYSYSENEIIKALAPINLFSKIETDIIELADRVLISKNLFISKDKTFEFSLDSNVEEAQLYFFVNSAKGNLIVEINGNVVYEGEVTSSEVPIKISGDYLKENNKLVLRLGSFGLFSHKYELSDVRIVQKIRSESKSASRTFVVGADDLENLKEVVLDYYIYCKDVANVGRMEIRLNGHILMPEDIVVCEFTQPTLDIPIGYLVSGSNILEFEIDSGDYRVEQIEVGLLLKEKFFPKYNFDISRDDFEDVLDGDKQIMLGMALEGDKDQKANIWLSAHGETINMNTDEDEYIIDISDYVERGDNLLQVIPKNDFYIESLKIWIE